MKKDTLQLVIDIYEHFNSTCIINSDTLTIDSSDYFEHYTSREMLANDLLISIYEYTKNIE